MPETIILITWEDSQGHRHKWTAAEQSDGVSFVYHEHMDSLPITNGTMNEDELEPAITSILERTVQ